MTSIELTNKQILENPIGLAERGENPTAIIKLQSGWVVFGMTQFFPGYCILLATPEVRELNDLDDEARAQFLRDMTLAGDAIRAECQPLRLNYAILGNELPILHAHIHPRYAHEPEPNRTSPVYSYDTAEFQKPEHSWRQPEHRQRMERLRARLAEQVDA